MPRRLVEDDMLADMAGRLNGHSCLLDMWQGAAWELFSFGGAFYFHFFKLRNDSDRTATRSGHG